MMSRILAYVFFVSVLGLTSCKTHSYVADIDTINYRMGSWYEEDAEMNALLTPYKEELDVSMDEVIARTSQKLTKERPSSTLGNWFTDILAEEGERLSGESIDFAAQNYGGLRIGSISAGDVTVRHIYELMPFDNYLVVLKLDGETVQELLDLMAGHGGWPVSSGMSFKIDGDKAREIMIQGAPLDKRKTYNVVLPDYIANGGDKAFFLKDKERMDSKYLLRDLVIDHLRDLPEGEKAIIIDNTQRIYR